MSLSFLLEFITGSSRIFVPVDKLDVEFEFEFKFKENPINKFAKKCALRQGVSDMLLVVR